MRTITELSKLNGKVYVHLNNEAVVMKFLIDAGSENVKEEYRKYLKDIMGAY